MSLRTEMQKTIRRWRHETAVELDPLVYLMQSHEDWVRDLEGKRKWLDALYEGWEPYDPTMDGPEAREVVCNHE